MIIEYYAENFAVVDEKKLRQPRIPNEEFERIHKNSVIVTHDVAIWYQNGFLLLERGNNPARGELWPVGGRIERGVPVEESLQKKAREECGLIIYNGGFLGMGRTFFETEPFGHGCGTDTINMMFYAEGAGEIKIDSNHKRYKIFSVEEILSGRQQFHPYVKQILSESIKRRDKNAESI